MYIDSLTTSALAGVLRAEVLGARVQEVLQPDRASVALELYAGARRYLTVSADPAHEGLDLAPDRARRGEGAPTPLTLAARAHLVGARLTAVDQPPWERILRLSFQGASRWQIVAELMGRLANVILLDGAGTVVAAAHAVTGRMSRARVVLPGQAYAPPPTPAKLPVERVTEDLAAAWFAASPPDAAWRQLVRHVLGASPLVAREAVFRAAGDPEAASGAVDVPSVCASLHALLALPDTLAWSPSVARQGNRVVAYAPYPLTHLGSEPGGAAVVEPVASIADAVAAFIRSRAGTDAYHDARRGVADVLESARARLARRRASLAAQQIDAAAIERLRLAGDLILAFQTTIRPGDTTFTSPPGTGLEGAVELDPARTPVDNAQDFYRRYRRKRRAADEVPARLAEADAALATVDQLATDLALAEDRAAINVVRDTLRELAYLPGAGAPSAGGPGGGQAASGPDGGRPGSGPPLGKRPASGASRPLELVSSDGLTVLVGRNSRQNEDVTFRRSARTDVWLHARGVPGGHVVVRSGGRPVPERTLCEAAALAAYFSRARGEARADVATTEVRHVRRLRGGGPGMVTYDHDSTIVVAPAAPGALGLVAAAGAERRRRR